ncbi:MAG TPA: dephospho-CoA kinase [Polyangiales bacterium]|nr:dephospho-CoA kinase [Polyangiales bacterium]
MQAKAVIGLTGGIASGKSVVARELRALGVEVIDADILAREVVAKGTGGLAEVVRAFGDEVLQRDGTLDRERVAARVFNDAEARKQLNGILHPRIAQLSLERIAAAQATATPYVVYEAPLLVETGSYKGLSALVVVATAPATQLTRVVARDAMTTEAAQARLAAQMPLEAKVAVADYVIHNDAGLAELRSQVSVLHQTLCERFARSNASETPS